MTYDEIASAIKQMFRRGTLRASAAGVDHITADFDAHKGDSPDGAPLATPWGVTGLPPAGATVLAAALGGRSDRLVVIGAEKPAARPKGLRPGATALHDDGKNQLRLDMDGGLVAFSSRDVLVIRKQGQKIYLGGDPAQGGVFAAVQTTAGPSSCVFALVADRDYAPPGG